MNQLLQRQITEIFGEKYKLPEHYLPLFELINQSYYQYEEDKQMLQQKIEETSEKVAQLSAAELKQSRDALNLADERLKLATVAANVGIWELDLITDKVIWNETTYGLYGITNKSLDCVQIWQTHVHPEDREMAHHEMQLAIKGQKDFDIEYRVIWPDN